MGRLAAAVSLLEALATPHGVDRYLELVDPGLSVHDLRARVTEVARPTPDTVRLTLRPNQRWTGFDAGQFVQLTVEIDGVRRSRCFSPASSQHRGDGQFELTVKAHPDGLVSRYLFAQGTPGLVVGLTQAAGTFRLPLPRPADIVLISGGSGVTPVLAMLRTLTDEMDRGCHRGRIAFLHYAAGPTDVGYLAELRALQARHPDSLRIALAYPEHDGGDLTGRFGPDHLDAVAPWVASAETFLCGPAALMAAVRHTYSDRGLGDRLHWEDFAPPPVTVDPDQASGTVSFTDSDLVVDNSGANLLEQAESAGLNPAYGCRMGICFSCTQIKASGCTRNLLTGELSADPDSQIQLCISAPVGDVAVQL